MSAVETLRPEELAQAAEQLGRLTALLAEQPDRWQRGLDLLSVGRLIYRLFRSTADPDHWGPLLSFAHGALNQACLVLEGDQDGFQLADARYYLGLVCAEIGAWTNDPEIARRSVRLLELASEHPAAGELEALGLAGFSDALDQAEQLRDDLREQSSPVDHELASSLTPQWLRIPEFLRWLAEAYEIRIQPQRPLLSEIRGWLRVTFGPPARLAAILAQRRRGAFDEQLAEPATTEPPSAGAPAATSLPPVLPLPDRSPIDQQAHPGVQLKIDAVGNGTVVTVSRDGKPLAGWAIRVRGPARAEASVVITDEYGRAAFPEVPVDIFLSADRMVRPPSVSTEDPLTAALTAMTRLPAAAAGAGPEAAGGAELCPVYEGESGRAALQVEVTEASIDRSGHLSIDVRVIGDLARFRGRRLRAELAPPLSIHAWLDDELVTLQTFVEEAHLPEHVRDLEGGRRWPLVNVCGHVRFVLEPVDEDG